MGPGGMDALVALGGGDMRRSLNILQVRGRGVVEMRGREGGNEGGKEEAEETGRLAEEEGEVGRLPSRCILSESSVLGSPEALRVPPCQPPCCPAVPHSRVTWHSTRWTRRRSTCARATPGPRTLRRSSTCCSTPASTRPLSVSPSVLDHPPLRIRTCKHTHINMLFSLPQNRDHRAADHQGHCHGGHPARNPPVSAPLKEYEASPHEIAFSSPSFLPLAPRLLPCPPLFATRQIHFQDGSPPESQGPTGG
jgi:hypothetical protein